jgi:hypothetical protein
MIICSGCGHANGSGDAFCGSCGAFLEWDGEAVPAGRVPAARAADVAAPLPRPEPPELLSARVPQAEHERPDPVRPDPVDLGPADLYCGTCGSGNAAGRSFCRRCGAPLADAPEEEHVAWWRRWWRALRRSLRRDTTYAAGERPGRWARLGDVAASSGRRPRRRWRPRMPARLSLGRLALPVAMLSLAGLGIAPVRAAVTDKGFDLYRQVRSVVAPRYVPVSASGATATSAQRGHDASMAIDQNTLTWWAEDRPVRARGERLTVRFDRPVDLSRVTVHNGAAGAAFPFRPRVRGLRVTLRGPDGILDQRRVVLADRRGMQVVEVAGSDVTRLTLRILSTYAGQKSSAASVAEVGFLAKQ